MDNPWLPDPHDTHWLHLLFLEYGAIESTKKYKMADLFITPRNNPRPIRNRFDSRPLQLAKI